MKGGSPMKAVIVFTGTGPLLILTSYPSVDDPGLVNKLKAKGIKKFICFEVPIDQCQRLYGISYSDIREDLQKADDMRVLDFDGHRIFNNFSLKKMTAPFIFEE
jgi:hypothetical protein